MRPHLDCVEAAEQQLHLAHVRLDPHGPRLLNVDPQVQRHVPVASKHAELRLRIHPVLYPLHNDVFIPANGAILARVQLNCWLVSLMTEIGSSDNEYPHVLQELDAKKDG